jgi:hypothetical protein
MTSGDDKRACAAFDDCHATAAPVSRAPIQPLILFDLDWSVAVCGISTGMPDNDHDSDDDKDGDGDDDEDDEEEDDMWTVLVDQGGTRAHVTKMGYDTLTLRAARPLQHPPHATTASFRVIIEDYGDNNYCTIGFVPTGATPVLGREICEYGGWYICVEQSRPRRILSSSAFEFLVPGDDGADPAIPPVPPGTAVEFTVDYTAHMCRVAFYAPAKARDFTAPPDAVVDLRFVPNAKYGSNPARSDPTAVDTCVALYPAVGMQWSGGTCHLCECAPVNREGRGEGKY